MLGARLKRGRSAAVLLECPARRVSETTARVCVPRRNRHPPVRRLDSHGTREPALPTRSHFKSSHPSQWPRHPHLLLHPHLTTMPTTPTMPTTTTTTPTERFGTATTTIKFKSPRASLQLTHKLGGYIQRMRLRAPTGRILNKINTKPSCLSLSATLRLPLKLGGY
jgi:hypothetical protein